MSRRLTLNLVPVEFALTAELRVGLQPYGHDRLEQLRNEGRGTYFYKRYRERDAIACVALDDAYAPQGRETIALRCSDAPWLVAALVLESLLDTRLLPVAEPAPAGHAGAAAEFLREVLPRKSGAEHEEDAGQTPPIRDAWATTLRPWRLGRQQRLQDEPEVVRYERARHAAPSCKIRFR